MRGKWSGADSVLHGVGGGNLYCEGGNACFSDDLIEGFENIYALGDASGGYVDDYYNMTNFYAFGEDGVRTTDIHSIGNISNPQTLTVYKDTVYYQSFDIFCNGFDTCIVYCFEPQLSCADGRVNWYGCATINNITVNASDSTVGNATCIYQLYTYNFIPTAEPTLQPTFDPSYQPSFLPTIMPSVETKSPNQGATTTTASTTSTFLPNEPVDDSSGDVWGWIIIAVSLIGAGLCLFVCIALCFLYWKKQKKNENNDNKLQLTTGQSMPSNDLKKTREKRINTNEIVVTRAADTVGAITTSIVKVGEQNTTTNIKVVQDKEDSNQELYLHGSADDDDENSNDGEGHHDDADDELFGSDFEGNTQSNKPRTNATMQKPKRTRQTPTSGNNY